MVQEKMYEAQFEILCKGGESVLVWAQCSDVQPFFVENLSLQFFNDQMEDLYLIYKEEFFLRVEEEAHDKLMEAKFNVDATELVKKKWNG